MKKISLSFLIGILLILAFLPEPSFAQRVNLVNAGGELLEQIEALKLDGEYFFDLYDFYQAIDFEVNWNENARRLTASAEDQQFQFTPEAGRVLVSENKLYPAHGLHFDRGRLYLTAEQTAQMMQENTSREYIWNPSRKQLQVAQAEDFQTDEKSSADNQDEIGRFLEEIPETGEEEILVFIDPGHGGRDPGAIGSNGLHEKDVVFRISLALRDYIKENHPRIKPVLTRDDDRFIPLQGRTKMANEQQADVFVSIHANSGRMGASGFEVFTLSSEGNYDREARELAEIENSALRYEGIEGEELEDIQWILQQLQGTVHTRESQDFAKIIVDEMNNNLSLPSRGVKQAPFFVLKDAQMPAVLVETGFLSNPREAEKLGTEEFQQEIASILAGALENYRKNRY
ncbi:MAG: N-acetylmuramoyl-L-alanine amidase family protein [bacterium]